MLPEHNIGGRLTTRRARDVKVFGVGVLLSEVLLGLNGM